MREVLNAELEALNEHLAAMAGLAAVAMRQATQALTTGDLPLAERVIAADAELDAARDTCEEHAQRLLALQSPVAGDLRTVMATLICAVKIERMGDLAAHLADLVRRRHPEPVVPDALVETVDTLGELTVTMADRLHDLITGEAARGFTEMDDADDSVDALCARLMSMITSEDYEHGVAAAANLALLARFYERFADQAVSVARRLEFVTTGTLP
ncbi:phosphate transport system protein [Saccharopolyspora dendranthemae]|uniref:Phosphate-specific transport system accessory protein PhoU n=1 Tax=Saccharopolyspora dendranthemae TaxID=1181886 RepID=A0A561U7S9_9PSEU|nr:phosphate transport system protein [Saccharopolyspora dendranthemae]